MQVDNRRAVRLALECWAETSQSLGIKDECMIAILADAAQAWLDSQDEMERKR